MATKTLFVWCSVASYIKSIQGYYCNNDACAENEYCCGDGICCVSYTVWELWYFWFGIVVFLLMLSTCLCLWKSGFRERILYGRTQAPPSYSPLPQKISHSSSSFSDEFHTANENFSSSSDSQRSQKVAPPSYDQATHGYNYKMPH